MNKRSLRVMLVDDNETDLLVHRRLLSFHQIADSVTDFSFAGDALIALKNCREEDLPHLILLDLNMPLINGWDFLRSFEYLGEAFSRNCRIVMVSATLNFEEISRMKADHRISAVLSKPLKIQELRISIEEIFRN